MPISRNPTPRVLLADPDAEYTALMGRQLKWAGYEVTTARDSDEALEAIEANRPDAAVFEVMMPGMTGYDLVRELRTQPENRLMPMLLISSRAGKLDRDFAFTVGADDYLKKPFRYSDVVSRLALLVPAGPEPVVVRPRRRRRVAIEPPIRFPAFATTG
jgi:two-component system response regulator MtrA